MACRKRFLLLVLSLLATSILSPVSAEQATASTITISGTVTGPSGVVPGVRVAVWSPQDWQEATTDSSGFYSVSIRTAGELWIHVSPDASSRLAQVNHEYDDDCVPVRLMFKWIQTRPYRERKRLRSIEREQRSTNFFIVNLRDGYAELRLQQPPEHAYRTINRELETFRQVLEDLLDI